MLHVTHSLAFDFFLGIKQIKGHFIISSFGGLNFFTRGNNCFVIVCLFILFQLLLLVISDKLTLRYLYCHIRFSYIFQLYF